VLFFDGSGLCVFYKRLDKGVFRIPLAPEGSKVIVIEERALDALLDGIDLESGPKRRRPRIVLH
jgi:transposase